MSSRRTSVGSVEDLDAYFANYVPLSNLPTPPPRPDESSSDGSCATSPSSHSFDPELAGPAELLANLVPSNASPHRPFAATIYDYLSRAQLPIEVLGLAACILDALSARFAASWRQELFQQDTQKGRQDGRPTPFIIQTNSRNSYSSCPEPEIIVLATLHLAVAYLSDRPMLPAFWARHVSPNAFSVAEINTTTRCVLRDIDYGLHSFTPEMVDEAIADMRRAGETVRLEAKPASVGQGLGVRRKPPAVLELGRLGRAVVADGLVTPEPSPPC
ncbi:hypothetical protein W97_02943 [Coniosporium apollinis CBS 100218]|uniref:Cyclin N-terminal domain-containing protein n=1 Tax=Coniosporium apollinis (strain CBS 100218) TaxID=1168221 RepID=R7YP58_CONA1|nr:uncharacterized protein W97_02943 [Coniosporium apollinis CBS 100218]EON63715.1 hypothetical protein W97_02943 [Coniosporium apollinis CBS 100218]